MKWRSATSLLAGKFILEMTRSLCRERIIQKPQKFAGSNRNTTKTGGNILLARTEENPLSRDHGTSEHGTR
jgi:hypothetical protein